MNILTIANNVFIFQIFIIIISFQALAMVEDEKKRYRPTKNYLEQLPALNTNSFEVNIYYNYEER